MSKLLTEAGGALLLETGDAILLEPHWESPSDQIAAGFPYYIQPADTTGTYVKVFDFGSTYNNSSAVVVVSSTNIVGTVTISTQLEGSTDGVIYGAPISGSFGYFSSLRYLRVTLTFTPTSATHDFAVIKSITANLSTQLEQDGGNVSAVSSDSGGTTVNFNKTFSKVVSITVSALSTSPTYCTYDFTDITNPTSFKVLAFNSSGTRVTIPVSWKARGII